jgi:hypothetical protein
MTQLPLFSAEAEAERTLREAFDLLSHDYRYVEARYEALKQAHHALTQTLAAKERDVVFWQDLARTARRGPTRAAPPLESTLKQLVALCHPDKWSQQQLATELTHELVVALNDARAQLEAQL